MPSDEPVIPDELLRAEAAKIAERYRVSEKEAMETLHGAFADRPEVARRIRRRYESEDVTRWRDYRDIVKACRKGIYYRLRRYWRDPADADEIIDRLERKVRRGASVEDVETLRTDLLAAHTSTMERLPHYEEFYEGLFDAAGVPRTVLDVGCGVHPLSYPFTGAGRRTALYAAVDKDRRALRALRAYATVVGAERLVPIELTVERADWAERLPEPSFELGQMLKVVPVVNRLDREALGALGSIPAERVLLTGSVESMTRRQRVENRERAVLLRFIEEAGWTPASEFRAGNEFGYLVE